MPSGGEAKYLSDDPRISYFNDEASQTTSIYRCYGKFNRDRSSFQVKLPKSVVIPETINAVRQLIVRNRLMTYEIMNCMSI